MADRTAITDLFSQFGDLAKTKLLFLGSFGDSSEALVSRFRSLNIEHVSPAELMRQEISRNSPLGRQAERLNRTGKTVSEQTLLSLMRKWFWARKPDAGFALSGFPATLLQAKVLDEWLDTRDEALHALVVSDALTDTTILDHYRMQGLSVQTISSLI